MSTNPTHTQIVQTMYAAFGRGDIPGILSHLRPDVDWRINVDPSAPGAARVPTLIPRRGHAGVSEFFQVLAAEVQFDAFQPLTFLSGGNEVAVRILYEGTIRRTGRRLKLEAMHHWTFDSDGKVTRFLDFLDTLADADAWGVIQPKA